MGYMAHDAVIVTTADHRPGGLPDIEAFRQSIDPRFRHLVVGPVPSMINGYVSYAFLPDGSKEGWDASNCGDEIREAFKALFRQLYEDGSSTDHLIHVRFGGDHGREYGPRIEAVHPAEHAGQAVSP
jgi:hypothetical protein